MLWGKPRRDEAMGTLKATDRVFIASQQMHRELAQIMQPQTWQLFAFYARELHPGCHTPVSIQVIHFSNTSGISVSPIVPECQPSPIPG